ncbi:hypothetical protein [Haloarcula marina]|uniref:hypothetical protein n=1 Tax=Haloarcula marina TaxID=2961574 RepID=UPI0020B6AD3C|nr:hypothetical protein [Halomicroarcula marina]
METPYTRFGKTTYLSAIFDDTIWEIGSPLAVENPYPGIVTFQSAPEPESNRFITKKRTSPVISTGEFVEQFTYSPTLGVWEVIGDETAVLWLVADEPTRDWPWAVYNAVSETVADTVGMSLERVSKLLNSTVTRLTEKTIDLGPVRQLDGSRHRFHRRGYLWTVETVERTSLESFIRWNFLNHHKRKGSEEPIDEAILSGLRQMASQLRTEAAIVERLASPGDDIVEHRNSPFVSIAYPTDTHRPETNVAVSADTERTETKLNPIQTDIGAAIEGVDSAQDIDIVQSSVGICSRPSDVIDIGENMDTGPVRVGADRWQRASEAELESMSRENYMPLRRFLVTRLGISQSEPEFDRISYRLHEYLTATDSIQSAGTLSNVRQDLRRRTNEVPTPLMHWSGVTGLLDIAALETPDFFVALPYSYSLEAAVDRLREHHETVRQLCRGCGTYFEIEPEAPSWTCERCCSDATPTINRTAVSPFGAEQTEYCYICLSPVAPDQLQRHHLVPRDVFEDARTRDDPANTVTVHATKCPGHAHAISHQALDADIDRAWNQQSVEHEPARWFNLPHLVWVLHELGDEMAPPTRQRVIEVIYRMWTEQFQ